MNFNRSSADSFVYSAERRILNEMLRGSMKKRRGAKELHGPVSIYNSFYSVLKSGLKTM